MKNLLFCFLLVCLIHPGFAQTTDSITLQHKESIPYEQAILEHVGDFPEETQLALAFIEDGQVSYTGVILKSSGLQTTENSRKIFEIGSITKVFTATLLAQLVEEDRFNLSDNINPYLPFELKDQIPIAFQSLANHTSGLPRMPSNFVLSALLNPANPYKDYGEKELQTYLQNNLELVFEPGTKSDYSNLGAALLAYTLVQSEKKSYEELLRDYIFGPLGMDQSTVQLDSLNGELVPGRDFKGDSTSNWNLNVMVGAGGILSSVEDLSRFALAQFDPNYKAFALTQTVTFKAQNNSEVGLGWFLVPQDSGATYLWHNGGTGGYRSSMALDLENHQGIVILSNVSSFHEKSGQIDALCFALMKALKD
ncbi:serine hydrolase domain-containing protein [Pararhodonellum marinum]|uniref:serine hydrolase domain-containing protein n=1 Tax=Pararhodonellum marinum TaxID=2755358 RepID=UPI001890AB29|nr:serine hydrolase domain-containing protein [Pararhodonellum marinum]